MKTKDVLARAEIDRETLRFYERKGLLPQIKRTNSGYRVFPEEIITRLQFIKTAKCAGFTLTEIRELVELKQIGATCKVGRNIASKKREELDEKMKALKKNEKSIESFY